MTGLQKIPITWPVHPCSRAVEAWAESKTQVLKSIDNVPGEGDILHVSIAGADQYSASVILVQLFPGRIWETDWSGPIFHFWSRME